MTTILLKRSFPLLSVLLGCFYGLPQPPHEDFHLAPATLFSLEPTRRAILEFFGEPNAGEPAQPMKFKSAAAGSSPTATPLQLRQAGREFFAELLQTDPEKIQPLAHRIQAGDSPLPLGLVVCSGAAEEILFFDFGELFPASESGRALRADPRETMEILYSRFPKAVKRISRLKRRRATYRNPKTGAETPCFELLTVEHVLTENGRAAPLPPLFFPDSGDSQDFHGILKARPDFPRGKTVLEIGVGSGINLLWALKHGAERGWGTDISRVYATLAAWNLRFAQDSGQIPRIAAEKVRIARAEGFGNFPAADLYLFNTPRVSSADTMPWITDGRIRLGVVSYDILAENFFSLFGELVKRLKRPGSAALWRVLLAEEAVAGMGMASRQQMMLEMRARGDYTTTAQRRAQLFFSRYPVAAEPLAAPGFPARDIFLISLESSL